MPNKYNRTKAAIVYLTGLMLLLSGCSLLPKEEEVLKPPLVKPQKESYNLYEVKRGTITKQIQGTGTFESSKVVHQEFKGATGKITGIFAKTGDTVKKGAPLFQVDTEGLEIVVMERERDLEEAKLALDRAKESRDPREMRIGMLGVAIAQYKLNEARRQLDGKSMTAEIDGVITSMEEVKPGDPVQLGKSYVTITDPRSIRLSSSAMTGDLQEVQVGMKAEVTYKDQKLEGIVTQCPSSAPQTDNEQLRDEYANKVYFKLADSSVKPELNASADIVIILQKKENAIVIPRNGLLSILSRNFVKVLEGDSIKEIDVEKGIESPFEIEIVKGLKEGQKIILQ